MKSISWKSFDSVIDTFKNTFHILIVIAVVFPIALDMTLVTTFVIGINFTITVSITTISAFAFVV